MLSLRGESLGCVFLLQPHEWFADRSFQRVLKSAVIFRRQKEEAMFKHFIYIPTI
jgi:hypothetical protein